VTLGVFGWRCVLGSLCEGGWGSGGLDVLGEVVTAGVKNCLVASHPSPLAFLLFTYQLLHWARPPSHGGNLLVFDLPPEFTSYFRPV